MNHFRCLLSSRAKTNDKDTSFLQSEILRQTSAESAAGLDRCEFCLTANSRRGESPPAVWDKSESEEPHRYTQSLPARRLSLSSPEGLDRYALWYPFFSRKILSPSRIVREGGSIPIQSTFYGVPLLGAATLSALFEASRHRQAIFPIAVDRNRQAFFPGETGKHRRTFPGGGTVNESMPRILPQ